MSLRERKFRVYDGARTPDWMRFAVIVRYAWAEIFKKRTFTVFYTSCFIPLLGYGSFVYLHHNAEALAILDIDLRRLLPIDEGFFLQFMALQGFLAFLMTVLVAPPLISSDLRNDALPLYLGRPLTRLDYIFGKLCVIGLLMATVTWVPGFLLLGLQVSLEPGWLLEHSRIALALGLGFGLWMAFLALFGLAVSAWVRNRPAAAGTIFGSYFVLAALGGLISEIFDAGWSIAMNLVFTVGAIWKGLLGLPADPRLGPTTALVVLVALTALAAAALFRRVRAIEVVR